MKFRSLLATGAALLAIGTAHAQDVTPAQRAALEAQLKAWYGLAGATAPFTVTPAGDHFDVVAPIRLRGTARGDIQATAAAKPGDNGKWSFTGVKTAVPFQLVVDMPIPPRDGEKAPAPAPGKPATKPVTYVVNVAEQNGAIDYDPSFATPSSWITAFKGMTVNAHGAGVEQAISIDGANGVNTLTPTPGNHADLAMNGTVDGYRLDSKPGPDNPAILATIDRITVTGAAAGIDRDQFGKLVLVLARIGELNKGAAVKQLPTPLLADLTAALQGIASSMAIAETFDGVKVNVGGMDVAMNQVKLGLDGKSDQGLLRAAMDLGVQGLKLPSLGLGELEALIPQQAALRPYISGVSVADASKLLAVLNEKRDPAPADIAALFSHGGIVTGLDTLSLDIGGTRFAGDGKLTFSSPSPQTMVGTARLTAENFDALIQKLGAVPMAQQAMPAVIFLKGIGRTEAGKLVWDINYAGGKLLVNNIDLSAMTGGAPKSPAPRPNQNQNRTR